MRTLLGLSAPLLATTIVVCATLGGEQALNGQASQTSTKTVWDGVFTAAQAERGHHMYLEHCSECHGSALEGGEQKSLKGPQFWIDWQETTVDYLLGRISKNMPYSEDGVLPGSLDMPTYVDIVAHLLSTNEFPTGSTELSPATSVGVQIVKKGGPSELPANAFVHVVGCLSKGQGSDWHLTKGSRPVRILDGRPADEKAALGDRDYTLKFVTASLDQNVGHRMSVSATLIGEGGSGGLNLRRISSVSNVCQ